MWSAASGQPFDTCHVQIDWWDREAWFVQDHQTATVRAYTDANGEMVRQYRFDAFGNLLNLDTFPLASGSGLFANFRNRIGHQGLFAERVDASTTATTLSPNPNAQIWYQSRSRWYVPELGRFMTSDPNATGVPTMSRLAMLGTTPTGPPSGSFSAGDYYADGWDTWTSYGGNPVMNRDPNGQFILGLLGGGGPAYEVYTDYADEALDTGANAFGYIQGPLGATIQGQQALMLQLIDSISGGVSSAIGDQALAGLTTLAGVAKINGRMPINARFAGQLFPLDLLPDGLRAKYPHSVRFKPTGFPDFTPYAKQVVVSNKLTGNYRRDAAMANSARGFPSTPKGYLWHHVEDGKTLQLIPEDLHNAVRHTGGVAKLAELGRYVKRGRRR